MKKKGNFYVSRKQALRSVAVLWDGVFMTLYSTTKANSSHKHVFSTELNPGKRNKFYSFNSCL